MFQMTGLYQFYIFIRYHSNHMLVTFFQYVYIKVKKKTKFEKLTYKAAIPSSN